jgi:hypothetical protein
MHFGNGAAVPQERWHKLRATKPTPAKPRLIYARDVHFDPAVTDPVKHMIGLREVGFLFGPSSAGKTFVAFDLAMAIAMGRERWCGRRVKPGAVLHVAFEGGKGSRKRLLAAALEHGDPGEMLSILDNAPPLNREGDQAGVAMIVAAAAELSANSGSRVSLIVIDTLSAAAAGDDENAAADMSAFVAKLKQVAERTGAAVLAIHHTGKDRMSGMRGSSALRGNADFVIELTETKELAIEKCREGRTGPLATFELIEVQLGTDDDGDTQTSCVVRFTEGVTQAKVKPGARLPNQSQLALDVLRSLYNEGVARHVPKSQIGDVEVPRCVRLENWRKACRTRGLTKESEADPDKKAAAEKKAFQRASDTIEKKNLIGSHGAEVWLIGQQSAPAPASEVGTWRK